MVKMLDETRQIFLEAIERQTPEQREAYLNEVCSNKPALRAEVDSLLAAHFGDDDLLSGPILGAPCAALDTLPAEAAGTVIGKYRLLEQLGEGGMAVVYRAEQQEPIQRQVALKLIKLGMDTKQVIARFEAERQALALMGHPNIARVFDAGATESGRPYFVMELVEGISVTAYCDQNRLTTQQRLELFVPVCHAVHHAHQKGIIHRDLKPSNILVTLQDGRPAPKVIDFGIAKATDRQLTAQTLFTRRAQIIGTPEYMSPEQADLNAVDVDTRTDIYSLGLVLYELLTGVLPFDADTLRAAALSEIHRIIREQEPLRPSTRLSALGNKAQTIAQQRGTEAGPLLRRLKGELEWIPLKAMRKDRTRRYTSAAEFAQDIGNYLNDRPLIAGPESALYRSRKLIHKHHVFATMIAAGAVALFIITILYANLYRAQNKISAYEVKSALHDKLSAVHDLYAKGRYQAAQKEIDTAFEGEALPEQAKLLQTQLLLELNRLEEAEANLNELTRADPEIAGAAHYLLARLCLITDPNQAAYHQTQAEAIRPNTAEALYLQAMCAASVDEAIALLAQALELDSRHYAARRARALAYRSKELHDKMADDTSVLIALRSEDYSAYALRAVARHGTGRYAEAVEDWDRSIALCSVQDELPGLHAQRISSLVMKGDYGQALVDARKHNESFYTFAAHLGLGEYDQARAIYGEFAGQGIRSARFFQVFVEAYAQARLRAGQPLELPAQIALKSPFYLIPQATVFYQRLAAKGKPLAMATLLGHWSPDGHSVLYRRLGAFSWLPQTRLDNMSTGARGALEVMDLRTGNTRQIAQFGLNPIWSADGKTIAYTDKQGQICLVSTTGGTPRKLCPGTAIAWSRDSRHIYFRCWPLGKLQSIAVNQDKADPVVLPGLSSQKFSLCAISPNEEYIAFYWRGTIHVKTLPEGHRVARWTLPWPLPRPYTQLQWHPNGKTLVLNSNSEYNQMGLCLFDVKRAEATHVWNLPRPWCRTAWSPDGSQLIVYPYLGTPHLLELDAKVPVTKALAPALATPAFLASLENNWGQRIAADPQCAELYVSRALVRMGLHNADGACEDVMHAVALIRDPNDPAVHALEHWARLCFQQDRHTAAEIWALGRAQIVETFADQLGGLAWANHPYRQLMHVYAVQGNQAEYSACQTKWLQGHALASGSMAHDQGSDTYTITGSGRNIGQSLDEFHFACRELQGDSVITAQVTINEDDRWYTKAGIMIRDSLAPDSPHGALLVSTTGEVGLHRRLTDSGETVVDYLEGTDTLTLPPKQDTRTHWLKLERKSNTISAQHSYDGVKWEAVDAAVTSSLRDADIDMDDRVYVGLAVSSCAGPHVPAKATFYQVRVSGAVDAQGPFTVSWDIGFPLKRDTEENLDQ